MRIAKVSILVFAVTVLLAAIPCQAAEKKVFNYSSSWVDSINPGGEKCSKMMCQFRGQNNVYIIDASDDRLDGTMITEANGNIDSTGSGAIWGTYQIVDADLAVTWEGTWQGQMYDYAEGKLNLIVKSIGHGVGQYEGLMYEDVLTFDTCADFSCYPWQGYGVGEIKDTSK